MASSFAEQIPLILYVLQQLSPKSVLDVGKGMGKYGFLLHEYSGIDLALKPLKGQTLQSQSRICIDAIEVNPDYDFPHLAGFYRQIYWDDIRKIYQTLGIYDVVLMVDVIEHLPKEDGIALLRYFISKGTTCVIATPKEFFQQKWFESKWEEHLSHWLPKDFNGLGHLEYQYTRSGAIFVIFPTKRRIKGFGNSPLQKVKRMIVPILNEFY